MRQHRFMGECRCDVNLCMDDAGYRMRTFRLLRSHVDLWCVCPMNIPKWGMFWHASASNFSSCDYPIGIFFFILSSFVFCLGLFFLADLSRDECDKGAKIDYAGSFYFLNIYGCLNHIYLPNDRYESKHQHPTFQRFVGMNPILGWAWIFLSQNPSRWAILG